MRKGVWVFFLLLCWWVVSPFPLEYQEVDGSPLLFDNRRVLENKLKWLDAHSLVVGKTSPAVEKKKSRHVERSHRKEPEKKPSVSPVRKKEETKRPALYYQGPKDQKKVALTFDDGPDWRYTARILDILKRENVRATFFLVGRMAEQRPDLVRRMVSEGHVVANHTWNHPDLTKLDSYRVRQEVARTNRVVSKITGRSPVLFRAPYGSLNRRVERLVGQEGMVIVHWNVDTRDWDGRPSQRIIRTVRQHAGPGAVILQHTAGRNLDNTVEALPQIIADLKKRGYAMVTVPELLGVPAYKENAGGQGSSGAIRN